MGLFCLMGTEFQFRDWLHNNVNILNNEHLRMGKTVILHYINITIF